MSLAEVRKLSKNYQVGPETVHALREVDLAFDSGSYTAIMGHSGSGKSTFLNILGCLDRPTSGHYYLGEGDVSQLDDDAMSDARGRHLGFIFQSFNLIGDLTVFENVELPLTYRGMSSAERKKRALGALERVGMSHRTKHYPAQLSGGQQQRVAVARAVVGSPSIVLADEPTGNLDSANSEAVMSLLGELHREGATICMVTHDPRYARHAQRTVHLFDGRIVEEEEAVRKQQETAELKQSGFDVA